MNALRFAWLGQVVRGQRGSHRKLGHERDEDTLLGQASTPMADFGYVRMNH